VTFRNELCFPFTGRTSQLLDHLQSGTATLVGCSYLPYLWAVSSIRNPRNRPPCRGYRDPLNMVLIPVHWQLPSISADRGDRDPLNMVLIPVYWQVPSISADRGDRNPLNTVLPPLYWQLPPISADRGDRNPHRDI